MTTSSKLMLTATAALAVVLAAAPAFARGKAKAKDAEPDPKEYVWARSIDAGVVFTDGNTETLDANYGFDFGVKNDVNAARWTLSGLYGEDRSDSDSEDEDKDKTTKNKIESEIKLERFISERQSAVLNFSYLRDELADLDYSFILSPAYRLYLLRNPDVLEFSAEVGPAAVWRREGDVSNDYITLRAAERFFWAFSASASIEQTVEYLPEMGDAEGSLINADVTLTSAMTDHLALKATCADKYNSAPAEGADENDLSVTLSLQLTF